MEIFYNNIFKTRATCLEMLRDRGYYTDDISAFTATSFQHILSDDSLKIKKVPHITPIDLVVKKTITKLSNYYHKTDIEYQSDVDILDEDLDEISEDDEEDEGELETKTIDNFFVKPVDEYGEEVIEDDENITDNRILEAHIEESSGNIDETDIEQTAGSSNKTTSPSLDDLASQNKSVSDISNISSELTESVLSNQQTGGGIQFIDEICVVKFIFDIKTLKKSLDSISSLSNTISCIIFVLCTDNPGVFIQDKSSGRSHLASRYLELEMDNDDIQVYHYKQLIVNITHHKFVPHHELVNISEHANILQKYSIKNKRGLPSILKTDPVCRYFNAKIGDIFRIHRKDRFGKSIIYRCVHDNEIDLEQQKLIEKNLQKQ